MVELKSNGDWTIDSISEWLMVSPISGKGDATLTLVAQPNTSPQVRSVIIQASTKDNSASLTISQEGGSVPDNPSNIVLAPSSINCGHEGGKFLVAIHTQMTWTAAGIPDWVTCSAVEGEGDAEVIVTVMPFNEGSSREANVEFGDGNTGALLQIKQTGVVNPEHYLALIPRELQMVCTGDSKVIAIECDEAWNVTNDTDWVAFDKTEGEGDEEVIVTVSENPLYEMRQAEIEFRSVSGNSVILVVSQEASPNPHFLNVSPLTLNFGKQGGSLNVAVECDADWRVDYNDSGWLSISTNLGTGSEAMVVTALPNVFEEVREATINVVSATLSRTISVIQEAGDEPGWANVTPDSLFSTYVGGAKSISITSNCPWTITKPSWITMPVTSGIGDAILDMMVDVNTQNTVRIGIITIQHGSEILAEVVVVQAGVSSILVTDVSEINLPAVGGVKYFHLTANQTWMIRNTATWFDCNPMEGYGNKEISVKAGPLESSEPREAVILIRGDMGETISVTVKQSH